jgi:hypothetical protein
MARLRITLIALVLTATALAATASAEAPDSGKGVTSECHPIWLPHYSPRKLTGPDDLPPSVRAALLKHLTDRLGAEVTARLLPTGGHAVDPEDFLQANPDLSAPSFRYELTFSILLSDDGPVQYCAKILLDPVGAIVEDVALPACKLSPDRCRVVGLSEVLKTAASLGVPVTAAKVHLRYSKAVDALMYEVEYTVSTGKDKGKTFSLSIRADDPSQTTWHEVVVYS